MGNVTIIPATLQKHTKVPTNGALKKKVAGYARVSTDSEEQLTSYEAQVDYYTNLIISKPEWEFVEVYTDEGISATNTKRRDGFNRMIADALAGKIDLIVTKSISRFSRNTVDGISAIRELKAHGCEVYFEKENIWTFDSKGELMLTILQSLAQEESRSISENVTWGKRKQFSDGKFGLPYKQFIGYRKGADGKPEIVPEEAEIVKRIYDMFMFGKTPGAIAKILTNEGVPSPAGKDKWPASTIKSILTNEKYKGSAILQKSFTVDFLTKKKKTNEGEVEQYVIEKSHEAIISPQAFDEVQLEIERRRQVGKAYSGSSIFSARVRCSDCGSFFGAKIWISGDKRKIVWRCNHHDENNKKCSTPYVSEEELKINFIKAFNILIKSADEVIENCVLIKEMLSSDSEITEKLSDLYSEADALWTAAENFIKGSNSFSGTQEEFKSQYEALNRRYSNIIGRIDVLEQKRAEKRKKAEAISLFISRISENRTAQIDFDARLFVSVIDTIVVKADGTEEFIFKNGASVSIK